MTLLDFEELTSYWAEQPPLHILVGAYLGLEKLRRNRTHRAPSGATPPASSRSASPDLASVVAELGPGFAAGDVHAGLAPAVLDFAELRRRSRAGN